jgi:NADPH:quinone reductase-like Zn-dependent oxidoreductase
MKAIRIHEPTGISGLVYEEVPDATPMLGDVPVKFAACGRSLARIRRVLWSAA